MQDSKWYLPKGRHIVGKSRLRVASSSTYKSYTKLETPHSGYHWDEKRNRFFEGWYFKVALDRKQKKDGSFAFMYSIEDPTQTLSTSGVGAQIMGPEDGYIVQYSRDVRKFWAWKHKLGLGHTFRLKERCLRGPQTMVQEEIFNTQVQNGFQVSSSWHQGSICIDSVGTGGHIEPSVKTCSWAYKTEPIHGWGNVGNEQKSTAGWLAALPVFEPHWQILMSYGLSTGWIKWGEEMYEFEDAPSYAEKNWGEGFPLKWFWIQCNTFGDDACTALTAGGGKRTLPFSPGMSEDVAMIGVHYAGRFIEIVPWRGEVQWKIKPWGYWSMSGRDEKFAVEIEATTDSSGTPLRVPTAAEGLTTVCRDTFEGCLRIKVWENNKLLLDLTSETAALEIGGGPWWNTWESKAEMREPLRSMLQVPLDLKRALPSNLWPNGL